MARSSVDWRLSVIHDLVKAGQAAILIEPMERAIPGSSWEPGSSILAYFGLNWFSYGGSDEEGQTGLSLFKDRVTATTQVLGVKPEISTWSPEGDTRSPNLDCQFKIRFDKLADRLGVDRQAIALDPRIVDACVSLGAPPESVKIDLGRTANIRICVFSPSGCRVDPRVTPTVGTRSVLHPECQHVVESIIEELADIVG